MRIDDMIVKHEKDFMAAYRVFKWFILSIIGSYVENLEGIRIS